MARALDRDEDPAEAARRDVHALAAQLDALDEVAPPEPVDDLVRPAEGLTEREVAVLAFERQWWRHPGAKEQAVRDRFGLGPTRYYQLLNALVDREAALRHDPMLVKRLRRARSDRTRTRAARRPGPTA